jgi:hypothetical protein
MKFMVIVKATKESEAGALPTAEEMEAMTKFNEGLAKDGVLLAADGLRPSSHGARLRFDPDRTTVIDGPFAETKELVAGYWIVEGKSREEVIERFMHAPFHRGETIEIRAFFQLEDFGDLATPELVERWEKV